MNTAEIDGRIAELEARHAGLLKKAYDCHVSKFDFAAADAAELLKKEIAKLKAQRAKILAGVVEGKKPEPIPAHRRMPRNITSRKMREEADAKAKVKAELPPNDASFDDIAALYQSEDALAAVFLKSG